MADLGKIIDAISSSQDFLSSGEGDLNNVHAYVIIIQNHLGEDIKLFKKFSNPKSNKKRYAFRKVSR
ncbi:hypothetical protein [Thalassobacillus sp. C254]|uniref:hypothetical protein n=1 Tax=Thalassobacillus sp. C254 TaxID=1225341 RepID=UPI0006D238BC|nr:hypothetical protein [Thalassobacillus sp. C254]